MKAFLVTSNQGEYEDYREYPIRVFLDPAKAEEFRAKCEVWADEQGAIERSLRTAAKASGHGTAAMTALHNHRPSQSPFDPNYSFNSYRGQVPDYEVVEVDFEE